MLSGDDETVDYIPKAGLLQILAASVAEADDIQPIAVMHGSKEGAKHEQGSAYSRSHLSVAQDPRTI